MTKPEGSSRMSLTAFSRQSLHCRIRVLRKMKQKQAWNMSCQQNPHGVFKGIYQWYEKGTRESGQKGKSA